MAKNFESLKKELHKIVKESYEDGVVIPDIRAAIHAVDLMMEQYSAMEILHLAKRMSDDKSAEGTDD